MSAQSSYPSFEMVMEQLQKEAGFTGGISSADQTHLPQAHALNCLTDIFRSAIVGKKSEAYIAESFQIGVESLRSPR